MVKQIPLKIGGRIAVAVIAVGLFGFGAPAGAEATKPADPAVLAACDAAGDLVVKLIQAGDLANAKKLKPTLQRCLVIQRGELSRRTDEIAKSADAMFREMDRSQSK